MTFKRISPKEMQPGDWFFAQQGDQCRVQGQLVSWTQGMEGSHGRVAFRGKTYGHAFLSDAYMVSSDATPEDVARMGDYGQLVDDTGVDIPYLF